MNPFRNIRCIFAGSLCVMAATAACATQVRPQVTGFRSTERITHLAPGGANAAREIEVSIALFNSEGQRLALSGVPILVEGFDGAVVSRATRVGQVAGESNHLGEARVRLPLGTCKGPGIVGPTRVHRISNRPEYWDVTYIPARVRVDVAGTYAFASFIHVCKEMYRGTRP